MNYADIKTIDVQDGTGVRVIFIVKDVIIKKLGILNMEKNTQKKQKSILWIY